MNKAICFVHTPFIAFAVACKHQLWLGWRPVNACHYPIEMISLRECKLFSKSIALIIDIVIIAFIFVFNKEIFRKFKLLSKSAFYKP